MLTDREWEIADRPASNKILQRSVLVLLSSSLFINSVKINIKLIMIKFTTNTKLGNSDWCWGGPVGQPGPGAQLCLFQQNAAASIQMPRMRNIGHASRAGSVFLAHRGSKHNFGKLVAFGHDLPTQCYGKRSLWLGDQGRSEWERKILLYLQIELVG